MAKRFIDTSLFSNEWYSELSKDSKLFFIYYITNCDHAGVLKINKRLCEFHTGIEKNSIDTVLQEFGNRLVRVDEGLTYFMPKFLFFQYPNFPNSRVAAQKSAINILKSYGFDLEKIINLSQGLHNPYGNGNGNGYGYDNGNDLSEEEYKIEPEKKVSQKKRRFTPEQIADMRSRQNCKLPDDYPVEWEKYISELQEPEKFCSEEGIILTLLPRTQLMAMPSEELRELATKMWSTGVNGYAREVEMCVQDKIQLEKDLEWQQELEEEKRNYEQSNY